LGRGGGEELRGEGGTSRCLRVNAFATRGKAGSGSLQRGQRKNVRNNGGKRADMKKSLRDSFPPLFAKGGRRQKLTGHGKEKKKLFLGKRRDEFSFVGKLGTGRRECIFEKGGGRGEGGRQKEGAGEFAQPGLPVAKSWKPLNYISLLDMVLRGDDYDNRNKLQRNGEKQQKKAERG